MSNVAVKHSALPDQTAELVRDLFVSAEWRHVPYRDSSYYVKYSDRVGRGFPFDTETYSTDFWKCQELTQDATVLSGVDKIVDLIDSTLANDVRVNRDTISLLAYRLTTGGHLRIHDDAYGADIGFVWYLSKNWRWDWGGLLLSFPENSAPIVEMPEFNKLVILNHSIGVSHCVTSVEPWAQDDRYMLVGMMRCIR